LKEVGQLEAVLAGMHDVTIIQRAVKNELSLLKQIIITLP
jgi:hypothetical protein